MKTAVLLAVTVFVAGTTATPWGSRASQKCASYCKDASKFNYEPGTTYVYDYAAETATSIRGASDEEAKLQISAQAELEVVSPCEMILRLTKVQGSSEEFAGSLERYPLMFSFQDGTVEHLCPLAEEEAWVLNIKRGVLSALQNTMPDVPSGPLNVHETDVTGHCEANYTLVSQSRKGVVVRRTKDLMACTGRNSHMSVLQSTSYSSASKVQSLPLLKCENECLQTIRNKKVEKVTCSESHLFRPFSNQMSGAVTVVTQTLTYAREERRSSQAAFDVKTSRTSLLFDHAAAKTSAVMEAQLMELLNQLVAESTTKVSSQVPVLFARLVSSLRSFSYSHLSQIYFSIPADSRARRFIVDAAPRVGTAAAMALMRDLVKDKQVTEAEANIWYASLAFKINPSLEMITAVAPILHDQPSNKAILGISAMINSYCRANGGCDQEMEIQNVVRSFEKRLGNGCRVTSDEHQEQILFALKALGNAGVITASNVIQRCYEEENPMIVRLAAIEAIRRASCESELRVPLMNLYQNMNQDSELRIAAYLALMQCPSRQLLEQVKSALTSESVNQVGSFVWTHLTNLQESSNPNKQYVKELLASDFLRNKFNTDVRKFSRNFEASAFWDEINVGGTVESNLIFSTKSYLPRSASLNLTVDLFGESINFLELGTRVEGFESLVESLFAPGGLYADETLKNVLQSIRGKREVDENALSQLSNAFDAAGQSADVPQGTVYMRIFGNDVAVKSFKGLDQLVALPSQNFLEKLVKLAQSQKDFVDLTKSFTFADASYTVPTMVGLPLTLTINGTATVGFRMGGKFDYRGLTSMDIAGQIQPSAALALQAVMLVDGVKTQSGVQLTNTLHTSSGLQGKIQIQDAELVSVQLDTPQDKVELFDFTSQLFTIQQGQIKAVVPATPAFTRKSCTSDQMATVLGVQLCAEVAYPLKKDDSPAGLLAGPAHVALNLLKTDSHTGYVFEYRWSKENVRRETVRTLTVMLDTPKSRVDRRLAARVHVDPVGKTLRASLQSPFKTADVHGKYEYSDLVKNADLTLNIDGKEFGTLRTGLRSEVKGTSGRHEPSFVLTRKGKVVAELQGFYSFVAGSKYGLDLQIKQLTAKPIKISADVNKDGEKQDLTLAIKSYPLDTNVRMNLRLSERVISSKFSADYSVLEGTTQTVDLSAKISRAAKGTLKRYSTVLSLQNTQFPALNCEASWEVQSSPSYLENNGRLVVSKKQWDLQQVYSSQSVRGQRDVSFRLGLASPKNGVDYLFDVVHQETENAVSNTIILRVAPQKEYTSKLELISKINPTFYNGQWTLTTPESTARFRAELQESESSPQQWEATLASQWKSEPETVFSATYKNLSAGLQVEYTVGFKATSPYFKTVQLSGAFSAGATQTKIQVESLYGQEKYGAYLHYYEVTPADVRLEGRVEKNTQFLYTVSLSLKDDVTKSVAVDLQVGRHITFDAKFTPSDKVLALDMYLFWDKDRDMNQAFSFAGKAYGLSGDAQIKYPGRVINLQAALNGQNLRGEIEWAPSQKIAVNVDFKLTGDAQTLEGSIVTPFRGYEQFNFQTSYKNGQQGLDTKVAVAWRQEKVTLALTGFQNEEQFRSKFAMTSTFANFQDVSFGAESLNNYATKKASAFVSHNGHKTEVKARLNTAQGVSGVFAIATPLEGYRSLITSFGHRAEAGQVKTELEIQANRVNKVNLSYNGQYSPSDKAGTFAVASTYDALRTMTVNYQYSFAANSRKLNWESELNGQKLSLAASSICENGSGEGQFTFSSPVTSDISASFKHNFDGQTFSSNGQAQFQGQQFAFNLRALATDASNVNLDGDVTFNGQVAKLTVTHAAQTGKFSTKFNAALNQDQIAFQAESETQVTGTARVLRFVAALDAPCPALQGLQMTLDYSRRPQSVITKLAFNQQSQTVALLTHTLKKEDWTNWESQVELSTSAAKVKLVNKQATLATAFQHDCELSYNNEKIVFALNGRRDEKQGQMVLSGSLSAPQIDSVMFEFQHEQDATQYHPVLLMRAGTGQPVKIEALSKRTPSSQNLYLALESPYNTPITFQTAYSPDSFETTFQWDQRSQAILSASRQLSEYQGTFQATLQTPFAGYQNLGFKVEYDIPQLTAKLALSRNEQQVNAVANVVSGDGVYEAHVELTSPLSGFEAVSGHATVNVVEKTATVVYKRNSIEITAQAFAEIAFNQGKVTLKINSPFKAWKSVALEGSYASDSPRQAVQFTTNFNGQKTSFAGDLVYLDTKGSLTVTFVSAIRGYETVSLNGQYDFGQSRKSCNAVVTKNSEKMEFSLDSRMNANNGNLQVTVQAPLYDLQQVVFSGSFESNQGQKNGQFSVQVNDQIVTLESQTLFTKSNGQFNVKMTTPFLDPTTLTVAGGYDFTKDRTVNLSLARGGQKIDLSAVAKFSHIQKLEVAVGVATPFSGWENLQFSGKYDIRRADKVGEVLLARNDRQVRVVLSGNLAQGTQGQLGAKIQSPYAGYEKVSADLVYDLSSPKKTASLVVDTNSEPKTVAAEFEFVGHHLNVKLTTPFAGFETVSLDGAYTLAGDARPQAVLGFQRNGQRFELNFMGNMYPHNYVTALEIRTPVKNWELVTFNFEANTLSAAKTASLKVAKNEFNFGLNFAGQFAALKSEMQVSGTSSVRDWDSFGLTGKYNFQDAFSGALVLEKNGQRQNFGAEAAWGGAEGARLSVKTPYKGYRELGLNGRFVNEDSDKSATVTFQQEGQSTDFSASLHFEKNSAVVALRTPFTGFEEVSAKLRYNLQGKKKTFDLGLVRNAQRFDFSAALSVTNSMAAQTEFHLALPVAGWENLDLTFQYDLVTRSKTFTAELARNGARYSASGSAVLSNRSAQVAVALTSPVAGYETLGLSGEILYGTKKATLVLDHNGRRYDVSAALLVDPQNFGATITTPFKGYETLALSGRLIGNQFEITAKTPFRQFQTLSALVEYDFAVASGKFARFTVTTPLARYENEFRFTVNAQKGDATLKVQTPFASWETLGGSFAYDFHSKEKSVTVAVEKTFQRYETGFKLSYDASSADFKVNVKTPFSGFDELDVSAVYSPAARLVSFGVERNGKSWAQLTFQGEIALLASQIEATFFVPFVAAETYSLVTKYDFSYDLSTLEAVFRLGQWAAEIRGNHQNYRTGSVALNVAGQEATVTWDLSAGANAKFTVTSAGQTLANYSQEFRVVSAQQFNGKASLETPYFSPQTLTIDFDSSKKGRVSFKVGHDWVQGRFSTEITAKYASGFGNFDATWRSTFTPDVVLATSYSFRKELTAQAKLQLTGEPPIQASLNAVPNASAKITVDIPSMEPLALEARYGANAFTLQATSGADAIKLEGSYRLSSPLNAEAQVALTTPFKGFQSTSISGLYNFQGSPEVNVIVNTDALRSELRFNADLADSEGNFKANFFCTGHNGVDLTLDGAYQTVNGFSANLGFAWDSDKAVRMVVTQDATAAKYAFTSPFTGFEKLELSASVFLEEIQERRVEAVLTYGDQTVQGSVTLNFLEHETAFVVVFKSPLAGFEDLTVRGSLDASNGPRATLAYYNKEGRVVELSGDVSVGSGGSQARLSFVSPYTVAQDLSANVEYDFTGDKRAVTVFLRNNQREINFAAARVNEDNVVKAEVTLGTSFSPKIAVNVAVDLMSTEKTARAGVEYGDQKFEVNVSGFLNGASGKLRTTLNTPFTGLKKLALNGKLSRNNVDFSFEYARGKKVQLQGSYVFEPQSNNYGLEATVNTPFFEPVTFKANTQFDANSAKAYVQWSADQYLSVSGLLNDNDFSAALESPCPYMKAIKVAGSFADTASETSVSASVTYNDYQGAFQGRHLTGSDRFGVSAQAEYNSNVVSGDVYFQMGGDKIESYLKVNTPFAAFPSLGLNLDCLVKDGQVYSKVQIQTPFEQLPALTVAAQGSYQAGKLLDASLEISATETLAAFKVALNQPSRSTYSANLSYNVPAFSEFSNAGLTAFFEIPSAKAAKAEVSLNLGWTDYQFQGSYVLKKDSFRLDASSPTFSRPLNLGVSYSSQDLSQVEAEAFLWDNRVTLRYSNAQQNLQLETTADLPAFALQGLSFNTQMYYRFPESLEATVLLACPQGEHKVVFGYSLTHQKLQVKADLYTNLFATKHSINLKAGVAPLAFEIRYAGEDEHVLSVAVQDGERFAVEGKLTCGWLPTQSRTASFSLVTGEADGYLDLKWGGETHRVVYNVGKVSGFELSLDAFSPFLQQGNFVVKIAYRPSANGQHQASVSVQYGDATHAFSGELTHQADRVALQAQVETPFLAQPVRVELEATQGLQYAGSVKLNVWGQTHQLTGHAQLAGPFQAEAKLESPLLKSRVVSFSVQTRLQSLKDLQLELNVNCGEQNVRFFVNGRYNGWQDVEGFVTLNTPCQTWSMLRLNGHFKVNAGLNAGFEFQTSNPAFPPTSLSVKYELTDSLDVSVTAKTPFRYYDNLALLLNVPLSGRVIEPRLTLSSPSSQHSFSAKFTQTDDRFEIFAEADSFGRKMGGNMIIKLADVFEAHLEVNTPFKGYERYIWDVKGQAHIKNWGQSNIFLDWNGQKIEFVSNVRVEPRAYIATFELNTPFAAYDKFGLNLRLEGTDRKTIHAEVAYPGARVGVEFDYVFNSKADFVAKAAVHTPFENYESFTVELTNQLEAGRKYLGNVQARFANYGIAVTSNALWRDNTAEATFEAKLNQYVASVKANAELTDQRILTEVNVNTPFELLRNLDAFVRFERQGEIYNNGLGLSVNNQKVVLVSVTRQDATTTVEVFNPIRPVSVSFAVENTADLINLQGFMCWDLNRKSESTLGTHFTLRRTTFGQQVSCQATVAEYTAVVDYVLEATSTKLDHSIQLSWAEGKSAGYKIALEDASNRRRTQLDAVIRFDLPVRSFEVESHHIVANSESSTCLELKWDAARDRSKRVGARVETSDLSSWNVQSRKANLVLVHSALLQDIVLSGQYAKGTGNDLFNGKVELTYSPLESHKFVVLTHVKDLSSSSRQQYDVNWAVQHPASNTDLRLTTGLRAKSDETAGNLRVDYQDRFGNSRFLQLQSKIAQLKNQIEMELRTTENALAWTGSLLQEGGAYTLYSRTAINDQAPFQFKGELNTEQPAGKIDVDYATGQKWSVYAGLPSDKEIMVKSDRDMFGKTVTDAFFSLKLNTTKLLSKRLYWRAESAPEIKAIFLNHATDLLAVVQNLVGADWLNALAQEWTSRQVAITPIFAETQLRVTEFMAQEWTALSSDFADLVAYGQKVYRNDEFYVRTVAQLGYQMYDAVSPKLAAAFRQFSPVFRYLSKTSQTAYRALKANYHAVAQTVAQAGAQVQAAVAKVGAQAAQAYRAYATQFNALYGDILALFGDYYGRLTAAFDTYLGRLEATVMATVEDFRAQALRFVSRYTANWQVYVQQAQQFVQYVQDQYSHAQQLVQEMNVRVRQYLLTFEPVRGLVRLYQQYASWLEEFRFQDYVDQFKTWSNQFASANVEKLQAMTAQYQPYVDAVLRAVEGQYQELQQLPIVAFASNVASRVYVQFSELTKYVQMETRVREVLREALQYVDAICLQLSQDLQGSFDLDLRRVFVYEPENGRIEYTQYLPVDWTSFKSLPQFGDLPFVQKSAAAQQRLFDNFDLTPHYYKLMDVMTAYQPQLQLSNLLPPFGSHAFLAGTQHYMTFDQKYYEFAGECSYLLVSDFVSNNFSVVVNYEGQNGQVTKKSLTVLVDGRQMDIDATYRVSLNGKKVELPFRFGQTTVVRHGHHIVLNHRNGGHVIDCNLYRDVCTVQISGWTFGKTGGLFGVYNNEPADDFLTPTRQMRADTEVDSFANSWKVGTSRCRVKNYAVDTQFPSPKNERVCQELFADETSVLRPCFNLIDATPYIRMCTNDLTMLENSPKKDLGVCTAASAYVSECRLAGVDVWMPPKCVRCELEDGKVMQAGELKTFKNDAPRSADVVFLVDQKSCVKDVRLANLPADMDAALRERGISNNRFAVVGFGGKGLFQEPHIRTTENQLFNNKQTIAKAFETMQFNGVEKSDVFAALRYAAKLPFRAGVSKQVILLTCDSDCNADNYADALTLLLEHDISLHLLQPRQFQFRSKTNEESKYVFGVDLENVYTARDVRKMVGDKDLRRQLVLPKDFCTPLALETNGTLFDLKQMTSDKSLQVKKFVDVFVRRVALASEPSDCQRCDCLADKDGVGYLQCQRCVSPSIEKFIKDWEKLAYESENMFGVNEVPVSEIRTEKPVPVVAPVKASKKSNKRN